MQGRAADALTLFAEAVRLQPDNADAQNNLGRLLFAQGKHDEGIDHLRAALRAQPAHVAAHFNLANALLQGKGDAAEPSSISARRSACGPGGRRRRWRLPGC